jgi:hypothetical protein
MRHLVTLYCNLRVHTSFSTAFRVWVVSLIFNFIETCNPETLVSFWSANSWSNSCCSSCVRVWYSSLWSWTSDWSASFLWLLPVNSTLSHENAYDTNQQAYSFLYSLPEISSSKMCSKHWALNASNRVIPNPCINCAVHDKSSCDG